MTVFVRSVCGAFQREYAWRSMHCGVHGPYITLSTYACRKRSNSEQERPNSGDTGGAEGASDKMSSQCAVPLPQNTMGLGECHKARDSRRTRLTASDKLDFLTAPDQGFRHLPSLQAAAAARNVHPRCPRTAERVHHVAALPRQRTPAQPTAALGRQSASPSYKGD